MITRSSRTGSSYCLVIKPVMTAFLALVIIGQTSTAQDITKNLLSEKILVLHGVGGNVTAIATDEGLVVIDTFTTPECALQARKIIEGHFNKPVRYLINTHFHADHFCGNQVYSDVVKIGFVGLAEHFKRRYGEDLVQAIKAEIDALQEKLEKTDEGSAEAVELENQLEQLSRQLKDFDGFVLTPPDISLHGNAAIRLGGKTLEILHFGKAHTDTDLVILVPEEQLLVMGDLYWDSRIAYIDPVESDPQNWIRTLDQIIDSGRDVQYVVPGHGNVKGLEALTVQRNYLQTLWNAVAGARDRGLTLEQAKAEIKLEQYKDYANYERGLPFMIESCWRIMERGSEAAK